MDPEVLYQHIYHGQWAAVLDVLHRHPADLAADPLLAHSIETFMAVFFGQLDQAPLETLETLFLLHTGRFYQLSEGRFAQLMAQLVARHAHAPDVALAYARLCPEEPSCARLIEAYAVPVRMDVPHPAEAALHLAGHPVIAGPQAIRPLFNSRQEVDFFMAVREVFATYLVYPNVALHSVIDYAQVHPHLTPREKAYFFRALLDCVVFDQHDGYRPRFFFELDSALHDEDERRQKDQAKDRILALAGLQLFRLRKRRRNPGRAAFVAALKALLPTPPAT
jgi:hypothetical protein